MQYIWHRRNINVQCARGRKMMEAAMAVVMVITVKDRIDVVFVIRIQRHTCSVSRKQFPKQKVKKKNGIHYTEHIVHAHVIIIKKTNKKKKKKKRVNYLRMFVLKSSQSLLFKLSEMKPYEK